MPVTKRRCERPVQVDEWTPGAVYVDDPGYLSRSYVGAWKGDVGVYRTDGKEWVVVTRNRVELVRVKTDEDARAVAEIIAATYGDDLRTATRQQLFNAAPVWFRAWGKAVRRAGKFLDPTPYLDGATK